MCLSANIFAQDLVKIPNVITPNDDNINDTFIIDAENYAALTCTIFNRYGEMIYRFFGTNGSWDGYTHAGVKVSAGVYYVYVELQEELNDESIITMQSILHVQY
tara:strand:- start:435 stop:746 length:312 start_codon:yes stop_codon:yes gene_type:complete